MNWFDLLNLDTTTNEQPEWDVVSSNPNYSYADEYNKGYGGATPENTPAEGVELYPGWTGTGMTGFINALNRAGGAQSLLGKGLDLATSKGGIAALMALLSAMDRQKASGGGTKLAYQGPRQYTRTVAPGMAGTPIARYAANGGMMQAYAGGGHVQMEDGGFVMTKRAVDGAGGPQGIRQLVPGARPIRGPGTGTSDSIPATIQGPNGATPAKVSNGEAYVPRAAVQQAGGPKRMYALMNSLQRKA